MSPAPLGHELIRASAGTGKTYELTNRYLCLLRCGQRPDDILASTFTRKAAGEILGRILLRLAEAATDEAKRAGLQATLGTETLTREECLIALAGMVRRLHRLRIGTLDSFFAQLAGSFALDIGLPPGWRIADEHEDAALRAEAMDAVLNNEDPRGLLTLLHALTGGETTRSLDREVRKKIDALYAVYRESSRDAWYRVPRLRELPEAQLTAALETLRGITLPQHRDWDKAHRKHIQAAEAGDWESFVKDGIAKAVAASKASYCTKPIETAVASAYRPLIAHAKAVLMNRLANQTEATHQLLERFHDQYQQLKTQARALRFEDLTFQLAERFPAILDADFGSGNKDSGEKIDADRLAVRLDSHLRHLLLDEFQDTSLSQWSVIRPLAQRIAGAGPDQSLFCVGDTKQAIYGWRGVVAEIFDALAHDVTNVHQRSLDTSWRSSPPVVQAVNQIFQNLQRHKNLGDLAGAVTGWQRQFHRHQTAEPKRGLSGYVRLQAARAANSDEADSPQDITLRFVAEQVANWTKQAPGFDVGVLVQRNKTVRRLIDELREQGIEASEEGGSSLNDSAAVRLILSLVKLADHSGDRVARFHVATSPLAASLDLFPSADQPDVTAGSTGNDMDAAIRFASRRGDAAAGQLARRIRRQLVDDGYGPTVYRLAGQLAPACNRRELRRAEKLIGLAYQYDAVATSRPRDFAAYVDSAKVRDPIVASVRVMTVHQAKGLEFDIVVLADLEGVLIGQRGDLVVGRPSPTEPIDRVCRGCNKGVQQLLPADWQRLFRATDDQDVAESLSVLYVAVTRAVHALHMIVAPSAGNEQQLHKTFGGLLRAALTDGRRLAAGEVAFEAGDREWFRDPGVERGLSVAEVAWQAESLAPLEVNLAAPAARRWRGLQRVSPSRLEGGTWVRLVAPRGDNDADRRRARDRGMVIHAWFQQIEWLDDYAPSDDRLREVAARSGLALRPNDVDHWLTDFHAMLARPNIAACLHRSAYQDFGGVRLSVETERPFAVRDGDRLLVGNIDRLVTVWDGNRPIAADILDFKTDAISAHDQHAFSEKVRFYSPQLETYCQAVRKMAGAELQQISGNVVLLEAGLVVPIPNGGVG